MPFYTAATHPLRVVTAPALPASSTCRSRPVGGPADPAGTHACARYRPGAALIGFRCDDGAWLLAEAENSIFSSLWMRRKGGDVSGRRKSTRSGWPLAERGSRELHLGERFENLYHLHVRLALVLLRNIYSAQKGARNVAISVLVDPLSQIFSEKFYLILMEKLHPHVMREASEVLKSMSAEEREVTLKRAALLGGYATSVQEAGRQAH